MTGAANCPHCQRTPCECSAEFANLREQGFDVSNITPADCRRVRAADDLSQVPDAALWSEVCRRGLPAEMAWSAIGKLRAARVKVPGRAKVFRPCPHCGEMYSAVEMRAHKPECRRKALEFRRLMEEGTVADVLAARKAKP